MRRNVIISLWDYCGGYTLSPLSYIQKTYNSLMERIVKFIRYNVCLVLTLILGRCVK